MPGKILVINGHGAKIPGRSVKLDPDHAIVTPGIASHSYSLSFDNQKKHLEQKTHQGKIWPIIEEASSAEVQWKYYDNEEVPDIEITPLQSTFDIISFFSELNANKTGWDDLTDPPHDPLVEGAMAVMKPDGTIVILENSLLAEFINIFKLPSVLQPLFYCDKALGKIKPLTETTLAEIYEGVKLISDFRESGTSLVVATCSPDASAGMKAITVQTSQPAMTFDKLFETELKVASTKKLVDPEEYKPKTQAGEVAPIATGIFTSRISMHAGPITDIAIEPGKKGAVATTKFSDLTKYFGNDTQKMIEIDLETYVSDQPYAIRQTSGEMKKSHNVDQVEFMVMPPIVGDTLEKMFYEALVQSKKLDYIVFPVIKLNDNYDEYARFAINAFRRFIQDYSDSKLKIIFSADNKSKAEKSYVEYAKLVEVAMGTNFEEVTSNLEHGPRQKTQATKDLEAICKALLADPESISCSINIMGEIEISIRDVKYNLTSILKNNADFEQLELSDAEAEAYVAFINDMAVIKPMFRDIDDVPTEEMYMQRDPSNRHKDLSYGEKLAITLYSGDHMYRIVNEFLRGDGTLPDSIHRDHLNTVVKEVLLVSAMATRGLSKVATRGLTIKDDSQSEYLKQTFYTPPIHEPIYRIEKSSTFNAKRQDDIRQKKVTQQKGFTSTTESTYVGLKGNVRPVKLVINTTRRPGLNIQHVAELCWNPEEREVMYPPGSEFKYYHYERQANVAYGIPVRTIVSEQQYNYGTEHLRLLRREIINDLAPLIAAGKFDEAMPHFLQWLNLLNLTEPELRFFDDVCQYINSKLTKKLKDPWGELKKIGKLDDDKIGDLLSSAAEYNSIEFIKTVLRHYPNANLAPQGKSLLMIAVENNSVDVARDLLERAGKISDEQANHLFRAAVTNVDPAIVRMLMEHGFNVNAPLVEGKSAITLALDNLLKNEPELFNAMVSPKTAYEFASAIFQRFDRQRLTALLAAVDHLDFLDIIAEPNFGLRIAGPDFSRQRSVKAQAVVAAVSHGYVSDLGFFYPSGPTDKDLLEMLKHGFQLDATEPLGFEMIISILFTFITKQDSVPDKLSESLDMILGSEWFTTQDAKDKREVIFNMQMIDQRLFAKWFLAAAKVDPGLLEDIKSSEQQMTIVWSAISANEFELARMLWRPEFKDSMIDELYLAFVQNNSDKIRVLASLGVDAKCRFPSNGDSLLHPAFRRGHSGVVRNLLRAKPPPNVNAINKKGETPFSLAVQNVFDSADEERRENIELVCELLKSGADISTIDLDKLSHPQMHDLVKQLSSHFDAILKNRGAEYLRYEPKVFIYLLLNAGSIYELTDEVKKSFNSVSAIEKLEETVVGIIKSLPNDSAMRAEYISKLQDPNSPIATFINSISGPQASHTLFATKGSGSIESILSKLEFKASTPKPSGSRD